MNAMMDDIGFEPPQSENFNLNDDRFGSNRRDVFAEEDGERSSPLNQNALESLDRRNQQLAIAPAGAVVAGGGMIAGAGLSDDPAIT